MKLYFSSVLRFIEKFYIQACIASIFMWWPETNIKTRICKIRACILFTSTWRFHGMCTKMAVCWVVLPRSLVEFHQRLRGPRCLHHQGDKTQKTAIFMCFIPFSLVRVVHLSVYLQTFRIKYVRKNGRQTIQRKVLEVWCDVLSKLLVLFVIWLKAV
jgi:hypothetical protein